MNNYYEILGVPPDATPAQIESRFDSLLLELEAAMGDVPVRSKNYSSLQSSLIALREAFDVLSDAELRAEYDSQLAFDRSRISFRPKLYAVPSPQETAEATYLPLVRNLSDSLLNKPLRIMMGTELIDKLARENRWDILVRIIDTNGIPLPLRELAFEKLVLVTGQIHDNSGEIPLELEGEINRLLTTNVLQTPIKIKVGLQLSDFFSENALYEQLAAFAAHPSLPSGIRGKSLSLIPETLKKLKKQTGSIPPEFIDDIHRLVVTGNTIEARSELGYKCVDFFAELLDWNFLIRLAENKLTPASVREHALGKLFVVSEAVYEKFHLMPVGLHRSILRLLSSDMDISLLERIGDDFVHFYSRNNLPGLLHDIGREQLLPKKVRELACTLGGLSREEASPLPFTARNIGSKLPKSPSGRPALKLIRGGKD